MYFVPKKIFGWKKTYYLEVWVGTRVGYKLKVQGMDSNPVNNYMHVYSNCK